MRIIVGAVLALSFYAFAATTTNADEKSHREALETLLEMFDMADTLEQSLDQMVDVTIQQNPYLGLYREVLRKFYAKHLTWNKLKGEFIEIYREEFTENEVRELIVFYRSPAGRKALQKLPVLMAKCAQIGNSRLREKIPEWHQILQEETQKLRQQQESEGQSPDREAKAPGG